MYAEVKDKLSLDTEADVAGYIVNETRELSLDDLMDHSDNTAKSGFVLISYIPGGPKKRPEIYVTIMPRILHGAKFPLAHL